MAKRIQHIKTNQMIIVNEIKKNNKNSSITESLACTIITQYSAE